MIGRSGGFRGMYERLAQSLSELPAPLVIQTQAGDVEGAYSRILAAVTRTA